MIGKGLFGLAALGIAAAVTAITIYETKKKKRRKREQAPKDADFYLIDSMDGSLETFDDDSEGFYNVDADSDIGL